jgi:copper homeostasis protein
VNLMVEAAVESADEARFAVSNGAARLEVCDFAVEGGRTPIGAVVRDVSQRVPVPLHVMIRPRGASFNYAEPELQVMERQIDEAKAMGVAGVVLGTLLPDRRIDQVALARLIGRSRPLEVVFHRAIDMTPDPVKALEGLVSLGVDRVLTSGGAATALEGANTIRRMVESAGNMLVVIAGGGVRARNVRQVVERTGVLEVHARDVSGIREAMA